MSTIAYTLTPVAKRPKAIRDVICLDPKMLGDWLEQPITRLVISAMEELCAARAPRPGLQPHDFAEAAGEVAGMQQICVLLRDPELLASLVDFTPEGGQRQLPPATYKPRAPKAAAPKPAA